METLRKAVVDLVLAIDVTVQLDCTTFSATSFNSDLLGDANMYVADVIHFWYYFCNPEVGKILTSISLINFNYCYFRLLEKKEMHV